MHLLKMKFASLLETNLNFMLRNIEDYCAAYINKIINYNDFIIIIYCDNMSLSAR